MRFTSKNSKKNYRALACAMAMVTGLSVAQVASAEAPTESGVIVNMADGKLATVDNNGNGADISKGKQTGTNDANGTVVELSLIHI